MRSLPGPLAVMLRYISKRDMIMYVDGGPVGLFGYSLGRIPKLVRPHQGRLSSVASHSLSTCYGVHYRLLLLPRTLPCCSSRHDIDWPPSTQSRYPAVSQRPALTASRVSFICSTFHPKVHFLHLIFAHHTIPILAPFAEIRLSILILA